MSFEGQTKLAAAALGLTCSISVYAASGAVAFSVSAYEPVSKDKAVVLVSANWARRWKCGAFESATLQSLGFDRMGSDKAVAAMPDVLIEDDSWLPAKQGFKNYALIIEPGEYLLTSYKIKAAKSTSQVGYFSGDRSTMVSDGKSKAGSFSVAPGEVVYIGHFGIDCTQAPMPWRFYPEQKADFSSYLNGVAKEFPGLPTDRAKFRLFETTVIGNPFQLPE